MTNNEILRLSSIFCRVSRINIISGFLHLYSNAVKIIVLVYFCSLHTFPTVKKNLDGRRRWIHALSRATSLQNPSFLEPKKDHRVCSSHFVGGGPTDEHPDPEVNLGHNKKRALSTEKTDRGARHEKRARREEEIGETRKATENITADTAEDNSTTSSSTNSDGNGHNIALRFILMLLFSLVRKLRKENTNLKRENNILKQKLHAKNNRNNIAQCLSSKLLKSNADVNFYTGIETISLFKKLQDFIAPFVKRRWKGMKCISTKVRKFVKSPRKFGPQRKLNSMDEFLLTLMWLRLGLLKKDLADRFNISATLCSQIFNSWLTAMSKVLGLMVFWPTKEQVSATKPTRYRHLPDLRTIIDCSEIFIETPKDPKLQTSTWSDYKHHNTGKFLIGVAPNSAITFISSVFNGRASDKGVTLASGFLDKLEPYDMIQADKGFNIAEECAIRRVHLHVPPGKRGQAQMSTAQNNKTSRIANLRILVEQVIRRLKTFRLIKHGVSISLIPALDKILIVCAALCNLREPIYKD